MPKVGKVRTSKENRASPYGNAPGGGTFGGLGMTLQKKFGQHLLKNMGILDKIVEAAQIKSTDVVFEIGPGTGNLTAKLLPLAKRVVASEVDPRMVSEVKKRAQLMGRTNLEVIEGDVLRTQWPVFHVCTANLPYQISSPFTFKLLAHRPAFRCAVLMFQKEFAERLVAEPGENFYGRLAVNTRLFVKVTRVCKVSKGSFTPPPEVDSMVVKMVPRDPPIDVNFREWDGMMRVCFLRKRKILQSSFKTTSILKTLEGNYRTWCALTSTKPTDQPFKDVVMGILKESGLGDKRAITLDLDAYFGLLLAFNKRGIHFSNVADQNGGLRQKGGAEQEEEVPDALFDDMGDDDGGDGE